MRRPSFHPPTLTVSLLALALVSISGCGDQKGEPAKETATAAQQTPDPTPGAPPVPSAPPQTMPDPAMVVATVNGRPITARQVWGLAAAQIQQLRMQGQQVPESAGPDVRRAALRFLIDGHLMAEAARKSGARVDPKQVDDLYAKMKGRMRSEEEFRAFLANEKLSEEELRADLERQLYASAFASAESSGVKPDEAEARKLYEQNKDRFAKPEEARVLQIAVVSKPSDPAPEREAARKKIEEAHAKAKAGEDFQELAKKYSQAPNAEKGGDVGYFPKGAASPRFDEMAFSVPVGKVSEVFETPHGYNIIKVLDRRPGGIASWEEAKPQLMRMIGENLRARVIEEKVSVLRAGARIEILSSELRETEPPLAQGSPSTAN